MDSRVPYPCEITLKWKHGGKTVGVRGSWDGWKTIAPMQESADGIWCFTRRLVPGFYEYKFVVDGVQKEDPDQPITACEPKWAVNNCLEVMAPIRIKLHGSRHRRGPPFAFEVDPALSMQAILEEAKARCRLTTTDEVCFALGDGTTLSHVNDFREDEHVYLDPLLCKDDATESLSSALGQVTLQSQQVRLVCTNNPAIHPQVFDSEKEAIDFVRKSNKNREGNLFRLERAKFSNQPFDMNDVVVAPCVNATAIHRVSWQLIL